MRAAAAFWGLEWLEARPLPVERVGLVVGRHGSALHVPGLPPTRWHPGMTGWRRARGADDPLRRALDLRPGESVLDATLGLGHDALVLRAGGATVTAAESQPLLAWLSFEGHAAQAVGPPLHLRLGGFREVLAALPEASYDHVYFDPLFPDDATGPNPTWAPVRAVGAVGRVEPCDLEAALRVARRRVVLKLCRGEAPPVVPRARLEETGSLRTRYAVYVPGS